MEKSHPLTVYSKNPGQDFGQISHRWISGMPILWHKFGKITSVDHLSQKLQGSFSWKSQPRDFSGRQLCRNRSNKIVGTSSGYKSESACWGTKAPRRSEEWILRKVCEIWCQKAKQTLGTVRFFLPPEAVPIFQMPKSPLIAMYKVLKPLTPHQIPFCCNEIYKDSRPHLQSRTVSPSFFRIRSRQRHFRNHDWRPCTLKWLSSIFWMLLLKISASSHLCPPLCSASLRTARSWHRLRCWPCRESGPRRRVPLCDPNSPMSLTHCTPKHSDLGYLKWKSEFLRYVF